VALVKNGDKWLLFEDESVELVNEGVVQSVFGSSQVRWKQYRVGVQQDGLGSSKAMTSIKPCAAAVEGHLWLCFLTRHDLQRCLARRQDCSSICEVSAALLRPLCPWRALPV